MRSILGLAAGLMTFIACGGGGDPALDCVNLEETACVEDEACLPLMGGQVVDASCEASQGPLSFQGCIDEQGCDDVITVGTAPGGTQYRFPNSCVPDDFTSEACFSD